jgi:hypothetical protein
LKRLKQPVASNGWLVAREKTRRVVNLANRKQNESKFHSWDETDSGGRVYRLKIAVRLGWTAFYLKEVDSLENTIRFWQEIYDERTLVVGSA